MVENMACTAVDATRDHQGHLDWVETFSLGFFPGMSTLTAAPSTLPRGKMTARWEQGHRGNEETRAKGAA
jgi:hypothetical protein